MSNVIGFSEAIGRRVRLGDWQDQKISTYRKVLQALDEARVDDACELADYFVDEAKVCWVLYRQWIQRPRGLPDRQRGRRRRPRGAPRADIDGKLVLPDGSPFDSDAHWQALNDLVGAHAGRPPAPATPRWRAPCSRTPRRSGARRTTATSTTRTR